MNSELTIAVHCLLFLNKRNEVRFNSEEIACSVATHPARVRKVLGILRKKGYVTTKEGVGGGYSFIGDLQDITMGDLYRVFVRDTMKPGWYSGNGVSDCSVASNIGGVMEGIYRGGEDTLETYFQGITLADVKALIRESVIHDERGNESD